MSISKQLAADDFNRARAKEIFFRLRKILAPTDYELLSLTEVKEIVRPKGETYRGVKTVPIDLIVGSEGRYKDFSKGFLPKHEYLRHRWTRVDSARLDNINLPTIRLYELGGVFFVRDGNHRVSVAKTQGVEMIDAEVSSLNSEIKLDSNVTRDGLMRTIVAYEKNRFYDKTRINEIIPGLDLTFTAPGRYDELLNHIEVHKYFLNEGQIEEIEFREAVVSWYENLFRPIIDTIVAEKTMQLFPGRTPEDLYMWIIKHWHLLKEQYGQRLTVPEAVRDFSSRFGKTPLAQFRDLVRRVLWKKSRGRRA